jgi:hypothetical protein
MRRLAKGPGNFVSKTRRGERTHRSTSTQTVPRILEIPAHFLMANSQESDLGRVPRCTGLTRDFPPRPRYSDKGIIVFTLNAIPVPNNPRMFGSNLVCLISVEGFDDRVLSKRTLPALLRRAQTVNRDATPAFHRRHRSEKGLSLSFALRFSLTSSRNLPRKPACR